MKCALHQRLKPTFDENNKMVGWENQNTVTYRREAVAFEVVHHCERERPIRPMRARKWRQPRRRKKLPRRRKTSRKRPRRTL